MDIGLLDGWMDGWTLAGAREKILFSTFPRVACRTSIRDPTAPRVGCPKGIDRFANSGPRADLRLPLQGAGWRGTRSAISENAATRVRAAPKWSMWTRENR